MIDISKYKTNGTAENWEIECAHGFIMQYTDSILIAEMDFTSKQKLLKAMDLLESCCRLRRTGETEMTFLFENRFLDQVAEVLKARKVGK
jgi:hypothetical protein